jgi:hypothetical protein
MADPNGSTPPATQGTAMSALGGTEHQAELEARQELVRARRERDKAAVNATIAQLDATLRRERQHEYADADEAPVAAGAGGAG